MRPFCSGALATEHADSMAGLAHEMGWSGSPARWLSMSFESDQVLALVDEGLGNSCYLVDLGDGRSVGGLSPGRRQWQHGADREGPNDGGSAC